MSGRHGEGISPEENRRVQELTREFDAAFGAEPEGVWRAPGRVNLIGEHLDYNNGLVLPFAIDRSALVAIRLAPGRQEAALISTWSDPSTGERARAAFRPGALEPGDVRGWAAGPAGVAWALAESTGTEIPPFELLLDSTVPVGSGLSSSHAVEVAVALALNDLVGAGLSRRDLARVTQCAENDFVGAPTGIMDQSASLLSTAGHAILLDCRSLEAEYIPLELVGAGLRLLVVDTRVAHSNDDGGYAARRAACERGAEQLGVGSLGELPVDADISALSGETRRRVRHVLSERARVDQAVQNLREHRWAALGENLTASHVSLRDDYEVSCPELDTAVESLLGAGALGARMTGAGFGGSAIGLVREADVGTASSAVVDAFGERSWGRPRVFEVLPGPGASRCL